MFSGEEVTEPAICSHETTCCEVKGNAAITFSKAPGSTKLAKTLYEENTGVFHLQHGVHNNSQEEDYEQHGDCGETQLPSVWLP
jgi:hypothetical protein